jgi:predicted Zn-ribbon and HTH transcriptional regulator
MNFKCKVCDYEWESRVDKPAQCPRCKRYDWDKKGD